MARAAAIVSYLPRRDYWRVRPMVSASSRPAVTSRGAGAQTGRFFCYLCRMARLLARIVGAGERLNDFLP